MKKSFLFGVALFLFLTGKAQVITENAVIIDQAEDTTQVSTINDIIVMQEKVNTRNATDAHIANVWSRKSYFNPGYVMSTLSSKDPLAINPEKKEKCSFKSNWGAQIQLGHSYTLHKGAIANIVQINLDYTYINLSGAGYDEDTNLTGIFQPSNTNQYEAWGAKKYFISYGMALGPSVTVAPFTMLNSKALHFIKLNGYFHFGYDVAGIIYNHKYKLETSTASNSQKEGTQSDILWGHGLSTAFGFSLSWKSIGVGCEWSNSNIKYESTHPSRYGKDKTPFKNSSTRIYLSIKY